jgi:hypothetical protein
MNLNTEVNAKHRKVLCFPIQLPLKWTQNVLASLTPSGEEVGMDVSRGDPNYYEYVFETNAHGDM